MDAAQLTIAEELLLVVWDPERGKAQHSVSQMLLGGAVLIELAIAERIVVEDGRVVPTGAPLTGQPPAGQPLLDDAYQTIRTDKRSRKVSAWMGRIGNRMGLRSHVIDSLTSRGVLDVERSRLLGLFPVTRHPVRDRDAWDHARANLAATLLHDGEARPRDAALGGLVAPIAGSFVKRLYDDRDERRAAVRRSRQLSKGERIAGDVGKAIRDTQAAAMTAVIAATTAASAANSGNS